MLTLATLSRWAQGYFAAGIVLFIATQVGMLCSFGYQCEGFGTFDADLRPSHRHRLAEPRHGG